MTKDLGVVGTVGRFKPLHKGHAVVLETLCERARHVYIGVGSSNRYDARNPFTVKESEEMINLYLRPRFSNYSFVEIPDIGNGPKWREQALRLFGKLDCFVTANDYVESLLKHDYKVIHPLSLLPLDKRFRASGTMVRVAMSRSEPWEYLVPELVASYLKDSGLVERFCSEFGLETIAMCGEEALVGAGEST